jgi:hypothetical protein
MAGHDGGQKDHLGEVILELNEIPSNISNVKSLKY